LGVRRALTGLIAVCCLAQTQTVSPDSLLAALHRELQQRPLRDRLTLLWDLATSVDPAISAEWSLEMWQLIQRGPRDMHGMAKNALTILSLTDPERAAEHYLELEPSPLHQPNEDPRIDCARHLFPRLWAKEGIKALPAILQFADHTSRDGQYPYVAIGHILPSLVKADRAAAHSLTLAAIHRLVEERGIWRTPDDYLKFLRESWPAIAAEDRRPAVEAALAVVPRNIEDKAKSRARYLWYAEYYLPEGTVRFDSEEVMRVYDLLPFVDRLDAEWGRNLRHRYPALATAPIPRIDVEPWRSGVLANPGPNLSTRVEAAFERHHLMFLAQWAKQDPKRAMALAQATTDPARRREAIALVLSAYAKVDPEQAKALGRDLIAAAQTARTIPDMDFLVALARARFAAGSVEDGERMVEQAISIGKPSADGDQALHDIADVYGEFRPGNVGPLAAKFENLETSRRLFILAGAAPGAMRRRPGYQEPE
jgi:hypothetical protein